MITALAIEIVEPDDLAYAVDRKVEEYVKAGTRLVWVMNPKVRKVKVFRQDGSGTVLRQSEEIDGENVLPGFRCPVADLFQPPPSAQPGNEAKL